MAFVFSPVPELGLDRTAGVLTQAFADYQGAPPCTAAGLLQLARTDSVDLAASRVIARARQPVGAALVARRGWTSRLAAMAILPASRRGAGRGLALVHAALARHLGRRWRVPALWPEELAAVFSRAGLGRAALSQWQMAHLLPA